MAMCNNSNLESNIAEKDNNDNHADEKINHPKHYNDLPAKCLCGRSIECIDIVRHMDFSIGNAIKYLWRFENKNGVEDLKKAIWYIEDKITQLSTNLPRSEKW